MGYCMSQHDSEFSIKPDHVSGALAAIKGLAGKETKRGWGGGYYSWVETRKFVKAETLTQALQAWRWYATGNEETGEITDIQFEGEKLGDDDKLFNAIAPFVEPGSFIEMQGEDGTLWRWLFDGKTCTEKQAKVSWD